MCTTDNNGETPSSAAAIDWREETINGGSLRHVDLHKGSNGWASPPGNLFSLRSKHYLSKKTKSPAPADYLLKPTAVDWLRSTSKLEHVLSRADNRVMRVLRSQQSNGSFMKSFVFAINLQVPGLIFFFLILTFNLCDVRNSTVLLVFWNNCCSILGKKLNFC